MSPSSVPKLTRVIVLPELSPKVRKEFHNYYYLATISEGECSGGTLS